MRLWTRAMPVGSQPIREFPGISTCWDVEDQRSLVLCCGGSIWHLWRRQMQTLRHKDLVEISDFEIPRFGSVFCFLAQSFTPSLIHTSSPYPNGTFCTPKTTSKQKQFAKQNGQNLVQKPRLANFWSFFFISSFLTVLFPQHPEPPGSDARATPSRGHDDIHGAAWDGDVPALRHFLRVDPEKVHEKDVLLGRGLKEWLNCDSGGGRWKVPEEIQHSQVWFQQKSWLFNVGVCLDLNFQTTND